MLAVLSNSARPGTGLSRFWQTLASVLLLTPFFAACTIIPLTRPVLKIGLVGPFQGPYRYVGYDAINAARLALREVNAAGGVGDRTIQLAAFDDQGTAEGARTAARNLVFDSAVIAVIGHFRAETTAAAREIYAQAGVPLVVAGTVEGRANTGYEWLCPLLEYLADAARTPADAEQAAVKLRLITEPDQGLDEVARACSQDLVLTVGTETPPIAGEDAVVIMLDPMAAGETVSALRNEGWDGIVAGGPALGSPLFSQITEAAGVLFASPYRWPNTDGQDHDFITAYRSLGPHTPQPGPFAITTYQAVRMVLGAVEDVPSRGEGAIRQSLNRRLLTPSRSGYYVYRWASTGTPELVGRISTGSTH